MNADALIAELQQNYYIIKEVMSKMRFERPGDYEMFLAAGFRSAWASSWSRAGRNAQAASTQPSTGSLKPSCETTASMATASFTVPGKPELAEVPDASASGSGAQAFLAALLRTHALTDSQYKALCKVLAIQYPARPKEEDVMRLDFKACVGVLCGGR